MNVEVIALTLEFLGTILIGFSVLRVHKRVEHEHRIDKKVLKAIHKEQWLTRSGLILIILGFLINLIGIFLS